VVVLFCYYNMKKILHKTKNHVNKHAKKAHLHIDRHHIKYMKWWFSVFLITKIIILLLWWYVTINLIDKSEIAVILAVGLTLILILILTFIEQKKKQK
jgi:hypothetical protein